MNNQANFKLSCHRLNRIPRGTALCGCGGVPGQSCQARTGGEKISTHRKKQQLFSDVSARHFTVACMCRPCWFSVSGCARLPLEIVSVNDG